MSNNHVMIDINASDDTVSGITQQLSKTTIAERASTHQDQGVYIPPGTSDEDELLILAGVDPTRWNTTPSTTPEEDKTWEMQAAVRDRYGHYLQYEDAELTDAALPKDKEELKALGQLISNALYVRHQLGIKKLMFSPIEHPNFPFWLPEHRVNEVLRQAHEAMFASTYSGTRYAGQEDVDAMDMS